MVARFERSDGVLVEPVGELWAVFCGVTGETALLNNETVSILEVLEAGPASIDEVCGELKGSHDGDQAGAEDDNIDTLVHACWPQLVETGLVRELAID